MDDDKDPLEDPPGMPAAILKVRSIGQCGGMLDCS